ncbi:TPA: hypothetical protein ROX98_003675 [Bacillus pseudomycoides]|nr:hypothetical protein [Bacillus pseudomycoides]
MKISQNKNACIAIGANIIFFIALYVYFAYDHELINIHEGEPYKDTDRDLLYVVFGLLLPSIIAVKFPKIAINENTNNKSLLSFNLKIAFIFLILIGIWFILNIIVGLAPLTYY